MNGMRPGALTAEALEQLSDEEFWDYARAQATSGEPLPPTYVKCELASGDCFIPLTALYEVISPPYHFALLPAIPPWMAGIFAWHGQTIAVIDLAAYLDTVSSESASVSRAASSSECTLLIADVTGLPLGLLIPTAGLTTVTAPESLTMDIAAILTNALQQIKDTCPA